MTEPNTDPTERQRDLSDYLRMVARRKWVIAGLTALVTVLAVVFSVQQASVYRATAQVLINRQDLAAAVTGRTVDQSLAGDPARFATTQAALAHSYAVAKLAVADAKVRGRTPGGLLGASSVTPNPSADILDFTVDDPDQITAATLANAYATAYTAYKYRLDTNALLRARNELNTRLASLRNNGEQNSVLFRTLVASEQQLHTMQLLQSQDTPISHPSLGTKVRPTPKRNGALGFGFGLLLGVAVAFVLEALDRRIRDESEIERELALPLLGRIPDAPKRMREKARLTMMEAPASAQADAIRRLATNIEFSNPDHPSQMLMVTSGMQREGKSTTAANLAVALARAGHSVVLIDLDLRQPSVASLFSVGRLTGLTNVVMRQASLDDALVRVQFVGSEPVRAMGVSGPTSLIGPLSVLPTGPLPANPGEFVGARALVTRVLEPLRKRFDYVIVDTPPMSVGGDAATLAARVDSLIVVTRLGVIDRNSLADLKRQLAASPAPTIGFVITGVELPGAYGYGYNSPDKDGRAELRPPADEETEDVRRRARS